MPVQARWCAFAWSRYKFRRSADVVFVVKAADLVTQLTTKRRISKAGDKLTRSLLATAAQQHIRWADTAISTWAKGLSRRLRKRGVQTAVARKLAVTMVAMWKAEKKYEPYPRLREREVTTGESVSTS